MKGQSQAVTAVLVTSIILGSVIAAYSWGTPLLEKRQNQGDIQQVEQSALSTYETIVSVSNGGSGTTEEVKLDLPESPNYADATGENEEERSLENFDIRVYEERDFIEIQIDSPSSPYPLDTWTLIRGKSMQNLTFGAGSYALSGQDLPGIVAVRPVGGPNNNIITYRIEFRNMLTETSTGESLNRIDLEVQGQDRATGETTIVFSNQGTEQDIGEDAVKIGTDEELSRERTIVEVDLR